MRTWLISDCHFNHQNILKYCNRPFKNIFIMNEEIIKRWNSVVKKDDIVYCLGDFMLGMDSLYGTVQRLNGRKFLILGNHDATGTQRYIDAGFEFVSKSPIIIRDNIILSHRPMQGNLGHFENIHGHMHWDLEKDIDRHHFDCSVERINYTPILLDEIVKLKNW